LFTLIIGCRRAFRYWLSFTFDAALRLRVVIIAATPITIADISPTLLRAITPY